MEPKKVNFDLKSLRNYGNMKLFYKDNNSGDSWPTWKNFDDCTEEEIEQANLRSILPKEIILDLEDPTELDRVKYMLKAYKLKYYIWSTGSKGYHINLFYNDLDKFDREVRKEIRKTIIKRFKTDETKSSEKGLLAVENKKHFKTGKEKTLIEMNEGWNNLNMELVNNILLKVEQRREKRDFQGGGNFDEYHIHDEFFNFISKNVIKEGMARDMVVFKNIAIALVKEGLSDEEIKNIMQPIINKNFPGKNYQELQGWVNKARDSEIDYYNVIEINRWGKENFGRRFYDSDIYNTSKESVTEDESPYKLKDTIKYFGGDKHALAKEFVKIQPIYHDNNKIWWIWNFKKYKWEKTDEIDIMIMLNNASEIPLNIIKQSEWTEIIRALSLAAREYKPKEASPNWIQFKSKIYDIKTNKIFDATSDYFITNPIPWEMGEEEKTPTIDKLFHDWVVKDGVQDESYVTTLYEIAAYCCLPSMPIQRVFSFIGKGANGKSTYLRFLEKLLGFSNITSTDLDTLAKSNFESSKLYRKLAAFIGEVDKSVFKKTTTLKKITGDDLMRIEFKGKDSFEAHLYAKPIIACNTLPETTDNVYGFFRRWCIVDFPNTFNEKKNVINEIPDWEYNNFANKAVKYIKQVLDKGGFTNEGSVEERMKKYKQHSTPIDDFIDEYCEKDVNEAITFEDFYEKYTDYLHANGLRVATRQEVGKIINQKGYEKKRIPVKNDFDNSQIYKLHVLGLKWVSVE